MNTKTQKQPAPAVAKEPLISFYTSLPNGIANEVIAKACAEGMSEGQVIRSFIVKAHKANPSIFK